MGILSTVIQSLIYPGLVFMVVMVIITQWIARKLTARLQFRRGPIYAGPSGMFQPLADFIKLLSKEDIVPEGGLKYLPLVAAVLALGALMAVTLSTPLAINPIYAPLDIIAVVYILLLAPLALAFLALSAPNPYSQIAVGRYLALLISSEPPLALSLLVPIIIAGRRLSAGYSLYLTSAKSHTLWALGPSSALAMGIAAVSAFLGIMAVMMVKPFDAPEAETELYWGLFTELGGPRLALGFFIKFVERIVYPAIYASLFLGGTWPFEPGTVAGIVALLVKVLLLFVLITMIDAALPRYRPDQAVRWLWKYLYPLSTLAIVLSVLV